MRIRLNEISNGVDGEISGIIKNLADQFECFVIDSSCNDLGDGDLLLKHGAIDRFVWNQTFWLIDVSGNGLNGLKRPTTRKEKGTTSWNMLAHNLESFLAAAEEANRITTTEINLLYGFDPNEEDNLKKWEDANPLAG
jgi:hypothetical protein